MIPREFRLTIAYLVAGFIGTFLCMTASYGWARGSDGIAGCICAAPLWPLVLLGAFAFEMPFRTLVIFAFYLLPGGLTYLLLSFRLRSKPVDEGLCPTCGYDLRGTPETEEPGMKRCAECGTFVFAWKSTSTQKSTSPNVH